MQGNFPKILACAVLQNEILEFKTTSNSNGQIFQQ